MRRAWPAIPAGPAEGGWELEFVPMAVSDPAGLAVVRVKLHTIAVPHRQLLLFENLQSPQALLAHPIRLGLKMGNLLHNPRI